MNILFSHSYTHTFTHSSSLSLLVQFHFLSFYPCLSIRYLILSLFCFLNNYYLHTMHTHDSSDRTTIEHVPSFSSATRDHSTSSSYPSFDVNPSQRDVTYGDIRYYWYRASRIFTVEENLKNGLITFVRTRAFERTLCV